MPDYSKSIIYKLECKDPNVTEIYIGATTDFYTRKSDHKAKCINKDGKFEYNTPKYCFMRLHGGWDNWQMIQIEEVNARNKRHLNQIESKYIKDLKAELNYKIPQDIDEGLEMREWKKEWYAKNVEKIAEKGKQWRTKNVEKIAEYKKEYRTKNAEKLAEYQKEYQVKNVEKIAEQRKEYRAKNAEKIAEKEREKVVCGCGSEVNKKKLVRHKKSIKHQEWENLPEPNLVFID